MNGRTAARLLGARRKLAVALLLLGGIGYAIGWSLDPFVFGIMHLLLGPLEIGVALLGVVARTLGRDRQNAAAAWTIDVLLLSMAIGCYAFLRTISWA